MWLLPSNLMKSDKHMLAEDARSLSTAAQREPRWEHLVERFCDFFRTDEAQRRAFGRLAFSIGRLELAAVAAAADQLLSPGPDAAAFVDAVVAAALGEADAAISDGHHAREARLLRVARQAGAGSAALATQVDARIDARLSEELERDPVDTQVIADLIGVGSTRVATLLEVFQKADALKAYAVAGLAADAAVRAAGGRVDRALLATLRARTREMLAARDAMVAAAYFLPLYRMAADVESVAVLQSRVVRLVGDALRDAIVAESPTGPALAAHLERLDPAHPVLLRARALDFARSGDAGSLGQCLDALEAASAVSLNQIVADARAARKAGDMRAALLLYGWLHEHGHAVAEAEKARVAELRTRLVAMRNAADNASIEQAAADVLAIEPDNARALWIRARALLRLRRDEAALDALRRLVIISPDYPGAGPLLNRTETRQGAGRRQA